MHTHAHLRHAHACAIHPLAPPHTKHTHTHTHTHRDRSMRGTYVHKQVSLPLFSSWACLSRFPFGLRKVVEDNLYRTCMCSHNNIHLHMLVNVHAHALCSTTHTTITTHKSMYMPLLILSSHLGTKVAPHATSQPAGCSSTEVGITVLYGRKFWTGLIFCTFCGNLPLYES